MSNPLSRWRLALNTSLLDDTLRGKVVGGIQKVAQQSVLIQIPAIATSFAALTKKYATLVLANTAVAGSETQLKNDVATRDASRLAVDVELVTLKTLVANNATSESDVAGMGFTLLSTILSTRIKPDPPAALLVKMGKVRGKARVLVNETGGLKGHYVAGLSADPITGIWTDLPGNGKERSLSGYASGAKVWVRFAQVRWGLQSDWSTPVLITFS